MYDKVLLIRLENIGDLVVTTPAIKSFKKEFKEVHVLIKESNYDLVKNNPNIDKIITTKIPWHTTNHKINMTSSMLWFMGGERTKLEKQLRKEQYDFAVSFNTDPRNIMIAKMSKAKRILSHPTNFNFLSLTDFIDLDEKQHIIDRHLSLAKFFRDSKDRKTEVFIKTKELQKAKSLLKKIKRPVFCICTGAGTEHKKWPENNWAELITKIYEDHKGAVVFVGSKEDQKTNQKIMKLMKKKILDFSGKTDMITSIGIIASSDIFIGLDSGMTHVAKAVETKLVGLYGPFSPKIWGYDEPGYRCIREHQGCNLCGNPQKAPKYHCMKDLEPSKVMLVIREVMNE